MLGPTSHYLQNASARRPPQQRQPRAGPEAQRAMPTPPADVGRGCRPIRLRKRSTMDKMPTTSSRGNHVCAQPKSRRRPAASGNALRRRARGICARRQHRRAQAHPAGAPRAGAFQATSGTNSHAGLPESNNYDGSQGAARANQAPAEDRGPLPGRELRQHHDAECAGSRPRRRKAPQQDAVPSSSLIEFFICS